MSVFKKRKHYYISFWWDGKRKRVPARRFNNGNPVTNRKLAERIDDYVQKTISERKNPLNASDEKNKVNLISFHGDYMKWARNNKRSWETDFAMYKQLIKHFSDTPLNKITESDIEKFIQNRMESVTNNTINHNLALLSNIYKIYNKLNCTRKIVKPEIEKLKVKEKKRVLVTRVEFEQLDSVASKQLSDFMHLMWYTGCRPSEVLNLQGKHIIKTETGYRLEVYRFKTDTTQFIPMHKSLVERFKHVGKEEFLVNYKGQKLDCYAIRKNMTRALKRAGIEKNITPYCFRHTAATNLAGITDINTVKDILGHTSLETTQKYLHTIDSRIKDAIDNLE